MPNKISDPLKSKKSRLLDILTLKRFSTGIRLAVPFVLLFALIGAYLLFRAFALNPGGTYTDWWLPSYPGNGFSQLDNHLNITAVTPDASYFWSHQFAFTGGGNAGYGGYIGLQSHGGCCGGYTGKVAIFSIFGAGATGQATTCTTETSGFDGGTGGGSSCGTQYNWVTGRDYRLRVEATASDASTITWTGTVLDTVTNQSTTIGIIQTPLSWGQLSNWSTTWTEYFGAPITDCSDLPNSQAVFSGISANNGAYLPTSHDNSITTSTNNCTNSSITDVSGGVSQEMGVGYAPPVVTAPFRINAGGSSLTDAQGNSWAADEFYDGGQSYVTSATIAKTSNQTVFQSERGCLNGYNIPINNGTYIVQLDFADQYQSTPGVRQFNVTANGATVLTNYDVPAQAGGGDTAVSTQFPVTVSNQMLSLDFIPQIDPCAIVSGIEILPSSSSGTTSPLSVSLTAQPATVTQGQSMTLSASVTGANNTTYVNFYDGSTFIGSSKSSPYTYTWNTTTSTMAGRHSLTAIATDATGRTGSSSAVTGTVNAAATNAPSSTPATVSLVATPASVAPGQAANLTWTSSGVSSCTASGSPSWSGPRGTSDTTDPASTGQLTSTTSFTLTCVAANSPTGSVSSIATVTVNTPPTVSLVTPQSGSTVSGTTVQLAATVSDKNSTVTGVSFSVDGTTIGKPVTVPSPDATTLTYVTSWNSTGVSNGTHTIMAIVTDAAGLSSSSQYSVVVSNGDTQVPTTPANLTAKATSSSIVALTWTPSTDNVGVAGYYIVRGGVTINKIGPGITGTSGSTDYYNDETASANTSYSYYVIAFDAAGNLSGNSNTATVATPAPPDKQAPNWLPGTAGANLTATAVSSSQINLAWNAATDGIGVTGYQIFENSSTTPVITVSPLQTAASYSYGLTGLAASTSYSFTIKAVDAAGNLSVASNTAVATTQPPVTTGIIAGTTYTNGLVPLANVRIAIFYNNATHYYYTDAKGHYILANLPPKSYPSITYSKQHYNTTYANITLSANQIVTKNVTLTKR